MGSLTFCFLVYAIVNEILDYNEWHWSYFMWKRERSDFIENKKRGVPYYQTVSKWWRYGWW